jgi:dTDP-glucose pyrophosphorylase
MRRVNLIPMAGTGQRFIDGGFRIPKPFLDVDGEPMVVKAARCLPPADLWIFICREEHMKNFGVTDALKKCFSPIKIITLKKTTEGQAATCILAKDELYNDDILTIGTCDNAMFWDKDKYQEMIDLEKREILIWTFRNNHAVLSNPNAYSWLKLDEHGEVEKVSVKQPVSKNPLNDHAIIGCFSFRKAEVFKNAVIKMIDKDAKINGEYYLDEAVNFALKQKVNAGTFEVTKYICWGTPEDYKKYISSKLV